MQWRGAQARETSTGEWCMGQKLSWGKSPFNLSLIQSVYPIIVKCLWTRVSWHRAGSPVAQGWHRASSIADQEKGDKSPAAQSNPRINGSGV